MNYRDLLHPNVREVLDQMHADLADNHWSIVTSDGDLNVIVDFVVQHKVHRVLELGTWYGHTSIVLADIAGNAMTVDPNDGHIANARRYAERAGANLEFVCGYSTDPAIYGRASEFDAVFLDTSHLYADTVQEIAAYAPRVPMMLLHDCGVNEPINDRTGGGGVRHAFYEWLATHWDYRGTVCEAPEYPDTFNGVGVLFRP